MRERNIEAFNQDVDNGRGYVYTAPTRLSSRLANERLSAAVAAICDVRGKDVLDVGCGDGAYTAEHVQRGARSVHGIDAAAGAVEVARQRAGGDPRFAFDVLDAGDLLKLGRRYDVAVLRGVLHHLYEPQRAIAAALAVAAEVVVVEPNGYNPVLKVIEKMSRYHREHEEQSFAPRTLRRWFASAGGRFISGFYAGLVPFFCPTLLARLLKRLERPLEALPLARTLACAVYVFKVEGTGPRAERKA